MALFGVLIKKLRMPILENFAMPVSMISGMAVAAMYTLAVSGGVK
jgi:hypothetical protein